MGAAEELGLFLRSCLLGACLAGIYDLLRIFRYTFKCHTLVVFLQDIMYFVLATLVTFCFVLAWNDGIVRVYLLAGELAGAVVYFLTISRIVMRLSKLIIKIIKKPFQFIIKKITYKKSQYTKPSSIK